MSRLGAGLLIIVVAIGAASGGEFSTTAADPAQTPYVKSGCVSEICLSRPAAARTGYDTLLFSAAAANVQSAIAAVPVVSGSDPADGNDSSIEDPAQSPDANINSQDEKYDGIDGESAIHTELEWISASSTGQASPIFEAASPSVPSPGAADPASVRTDLLQVDYATAGTNAAAVTAPAAGAQTYAEDEVPSSSEKSAVSVPELSTGISAGVGAFILILCARRRKFIPSNGRGCRRSVGEV